MTKRANDKLIPVNICIIFILCRFISQALHVEHAERKNKLHFGQEPDLFFFQNVKKCPQLWQALKLLF